MRENKSQVLYRMRLRLFKPRQPIPDVQTTSRERTLDPEVIMKGDDLRARAWESENETPIFHNDQHDSNNHISSEVTVRYDLANNEMCVIPGTSRESSPEISPQTDG